MHRQAHNKMEYPAAYNIPSLTAFRYTLYYRNVSHPAIHCVFHCLLHPPGHSTNEEESSSMLPLYLLYRDETAHTFRPGGLIATTPGFYPAMLLLSDH